MPSLSWPRPAAALPAAAFGAILAWWGWKSGAYFEVTSLPGTMLLLLLLAVLLLFAPWPGRLHGPGLAALGALIGLCAWTLLSGLWSPVPDVAWADAQRLVAYASAFAIGAWACLLLERRMLLALAPLALAGAVLGLITLGVLWVGHNSQDFFEIDATLRYPLGYRNAEAAFFLMSLLAGTALAASRALDWRLRAALLGSATLGIELTVLAQSRASLFAMVVGVAVLVGLYPDRLRALGWLALALAPAALALPWLLDVFQRNAGNTAAEIPPLHHACIAIALTVVLSVAMGLVAARLGEHHALSRRKRELVSRALLACLAAILLLGVVALARAPGGPTGFVSNHIDQLTQGSPNLETQGSRFGLDVRTNRGDFWRVSLDDLAAHPIRGDGAGGFRISYLQHRNSNEIQPEDPHSVEMLMVSELGLPGALLFLTFIAGSVIAALRARRLGPSAAALAAGALGLSAYWLAHASVDWFWSYPAITLPVPFALGAAAAPTLRVHRVSTGRTPLRTALAIGVALVGLTMAPFFLSARYTNQGIRTGASDAKAAYDDLGRAADLNPWASRPLIAKSVVAQEVGDNALALSSIDDAIDRSPDDWLLYLQKAKVLAQNDPAAARLALDQARRLNPLGPEIDEVGQGLRIAH